jgi:general secretion pathway protein D
MTKQTSVWATLAAGLVLCGALAAQPAAQQPARQAPQPGGGAEESAAQRADPSPRFYPAPNMTLAALLESAAGRTGRQFLIHARAPEQIYVAGIELADITYPLLLSILRNNELLAVEFEGRINVIPEPIARTQPTRLVTPDERGVADDELVTMVVRPRNMMAAQAVPILRPMMPQYAHLAAMADQNALVIVDRFANARRIAALIEQLDR